MEYSEYINSKAWQRRRLVYFWTHAKKCNACGSTAPGLHLHHLSYEMMGSEPDEDLMPLCQKCHTGVHQTHQRPGHSKTLRQVTLAYVNVVKERQRQKAEKVRKPRDKSKPLATAELRERQKAFVPANRRRNTTIAGVPVVADSSPPKGIDWAKAAQDRKVYADIAKQGTVESSGRRRRKVRK